MPPLQSWSPIAYGSTDPVVVTNSRGYILTLSQITYEGGIFKGSYAKAIQAAIDNLSNDWMPEIAGYRFDTTLNQPKEYSTACDKDLNYLPGPCQPDASDQEVNYVKVPDIGISNSDRSPWEQRWPGTVWVHRPVSIDMPIVARTDCTIDFLHNLVTLAADVSLISMGQGTDKCEFASVKNVRVRPYPTQTQAILRLNVLPGFRAVFVEEIEPKRYEAFGRLQFNSFENITILSIDNNNPCFDGIHIYNSGGVDSTGVLWFGGYSQWNTFRNIRMDKVRRGIFIEAATWNASYNNTNLFSNIRVNNFRRLVEFKVPIMCKKTDDEIAAWLEDPAHTWTSVQASLFNVFQHVIGTSTIEGLAMGGFVNIYGGGNRLEHVGLVDWNKENEAEYSAYRSPKGDPDGTFGSNYLCAYRIYDYDDTTPDPKSFSVDAPDLPGVPRLRPPQVLTGGCVAGGQDGPVLEPPTIWGGRK